MNNYLNSKYTATAFMSLLLCSHVHAAEKASTHTDDIELSIPALRVSKEENAVIERIKGEIVRSFHDQSIGAACMVVNEAMKQAAHFKQFSVFDFLLNSSELPYGDLIKPRQSALEPLLLDNLEGDDLTIAEKILSYMAKEKLTIQFSLTDLFKKAKASNNKLLECILVNALRNQLVINDEDLNQLFSHASTNNIGDLAYCLLTSPTLVERIRGTLFNHLVATVDRGHDGIVALMLDVADNSNNGGFYGWPINNAFCKAIEIENISLTNRFLNRADKTVRPEQQTVDQMFESVVCQNKIGLAKVFLLEGETRLKPSQDAIESGLGDIIAHSDKSEMIELLLTCLVSSQEPLTWSMVDLFLKAREAGNKGAVNMLVAAVKSGIKMNEKHLGQLVVDACENDDANLLEILIHPDRVQRPTTKAINKAFLRTLTMISLYSTHLDVLQLLIKCCGGQLQANQNKMAWALDRAIGNKYIGFVKLILECPHPVLKLDRDEFCRACQTALHSDDEDIQALFLNPAPAQRQATVEDMDALLYHVVNIEERSNANQRAVSLLLNRTEAQVRPSQERVDSCFGAQVNEPNLANVRTFMNTRPEHLRPSGTQLVSSLNSAINSDNRRIIQLILDRLIEERQNPAFSERIIEAYRMGMELGSRETVERLEPLVSEEIRRQAREEFALYNNFLVENVPHARRGLAFEVHEYADAPVRTSPTQMHASMKLNDAIFQNMKDRCKARAVTLLAYPAVALAIEKAIDQFYPLVAEEGRPCYTKEFVEKAKKAAFSKLASDQDFEESLCLTVTFIQNFCPDCMEMWIHGFINESITAYTSSEDGTSCGRGIRERVATGLRNVDKELDALFMQVEGPKLVQTFLNQWNPAGKARETARVLMLHGLTLEHTAEQAVGIFEAMLERICTGNNVAPEAIEDYEELKEIISGGIVHYYEAIKAGMREIMKEKEDSKKKE
ncbi:MAG: hypothetical protein K2Y18_01575 [Alphaproteobacteria bacterium]|jgi:uncharacterized protein with NRDE domain|nr:hypothetical protein [Alphaproteobacteria bacterium]